MNEMNMPLLRIQLEGLGQRFAAMIDTRSDELKAVVEKEFNAYVTTGRLEQDVRASLHRFMPNLIDQVFSYRLQEALARQLGGTLAKVMEKDKS